MYTKYDEVITSVYNGFQQEVDSIKRNYIQGNREYADAMTTIDLLEVDVARLFFGLYKYGVIPKDVPATGLQTRVNEIAEACKAEIRNMCRERSKEAWKK